MEKPEENTEKKEETTKTAKKSVKIDGVSSQINLGEGKPAHYQWARILLSSGHSSPSACMKMLMDAYENQKVDTENSEVIANLQSEKDELNNTCHNQEVTIAEQKEEIADLKEKLEAANKTANENATNGLGKQLQIEELQKKIDGAVIVKLNPVSRFFLAEMAAKTQTPPEKILEKLFIEDLQNPRANNLPYTVSGSRIREVMEELKGSAQ